MMKGKKSYTLASIMILYGLASLFGLVEINQEVVTILIGGAVAALRAAINSV